LIDEEKKVPKSIGTGFLISKDVVMTNNHVIKTLNEAKNMIFEFGYNDEKPGNTNLILFGSIFFNSIP
jgi:V8-like Glu-specific endopeptidase